LPGDEHAVIWFDRIEVVGPLAEFEGAEQWVSSPAKPGLALSGQGPFGPSDENARRLILGEW
jgi:hypothetical protein